MGRGRSQRIVRPLVLGIATSKLPANVEVRVLPEPREIASDLDWSICGRQEMQCERHRARRDRGCHREAEQLLQPHRQHRGPGVRIIDSDARTARNHKRWRRECIELRALLPAQTLQQESRKVQRIHLISTTQPHEVR